MYHLREPNWKIVAAAAHTLNKEKDKVATTTQF